MRDNPGPQGPSVTDIAGGTCLGLFLFFVVLPFVVMVCFFLVVCHYVGG